MGVKAGANSNQGATDESYQRDKCIPAEEIAARQAKNYVQRLNRALRMAEAAASAPRTAKKPPQDKESIPSSHAVSGLTVGTVEDVYARWRKKNAKEATSALKPKKKVSAGATADTTVHTLTTTMTQLHRNPVTRGTERQSDHVAVHWQR